MTEHTQYSITDTAESLDSVGVGDAFVQEEAPQVPSHGAAGVAVGAYIAAIARRVLWRYAWWLILPAVVALGGIYEWRLAVIALMLLLLVFPMVITIAVFNHGMHPTVVRRTRAETVDLTTTASAADANAELTVRDADGAVILTIGRNRIRRVLTANPPPSPPIFRPSPLHKLLKFCKFAHQSQKRKKRFTLDNS